MALSIWATSTTGLRRLRLTQLNHCLKKSARPSCLLLLPELRKQFLGSLSTRHLQMQILQSLEFIHLFGAHVFGIIQPQPLGAFKPLVISAISSFVLLAPDFVDRLGQILTDVKFVMHNVRVGNVLFESSG